MKVNGFQGSRKFSQAAAQETAVSKASQEANKIEASLKAASSSEKFKTGDVYIKASQESSARKSARLQSRVEDAKAASMQFSQEVSSNNRDANKVFAALIAPPAKDHGFTAVLGNFIDRFA